MVIYFMSHDEQIHLFAKLNNPTIEYLFGTYSCRYVCLFISYCQHLIFINEDFNY